MSAAVIDLEDFRKKRGTAQCSMMRSSPTARPWIPIWVWVIVWPV